MEHNEMSNEELKNKQVDLEKEFEQYRSLLTEVYENMNNLSLEYNKITEILNQRNEQ